MSLLLKKPILDSFYMEVFPMIGAAHTVHEAHKLALLLAAQASTARQRVYFPRTVPLQGKYFSSVCDKTSLKHCQLFSTVMVPGSNTFHLLASL